MKKVLLGLALFLMSATLALAQRTVTGMVKDDQGQPLIGATVLVKGTNTGAVTDINGNFSVKVANESDVLVISYTGYSNKEVSVAGQSVLDIAMTETLILQEAVVTAFGIKKNKENLGYAVTEIASKDLTTARTTNVTNALAAKAPGVRLSGSGGSFTGSSIIIRGFTTFTGSNQPLFVVDGIPIDNGGGGSPLQNGPSVSNRGIDLNSEDIENISVLKGAAATALYGSRAASGVILITTKKGKTRQRNSISYTANMAFQEVNRFPDYQNTYGQGTGGAFNVNAIGSWGPRIQGQKVPLPAAFKQVGLDSVIMNAYPDNVRDLYQRGINTQHNLAFQGGTEKTAYRLSLGYLSDEGVLKNNLLKRYNAAVNASTNITERLTAGISANYSLNRSDRTQQGNQGSNPGFRSWFTPRSWDLTNLPYTSPTGSQLHYDPNFDNPRWAIDNVLYDDQIDRFIGNFSLGLDIFSWLRADYKVGLDYFIFNRRGYDQIGLLGGGNTSSQGIGGIVEGRNISRNINAYLTLSGSRKAGSDVEFNYVLGQETVQEYGNGQQLIGRGIVVRNFRNLNSNTTTFVPAYSISERRLIGVFGNLTTIYKNWATLDLSVRNDWNSTLRKGNNSYIYYSVAGTLNVTQMVPELKSDILPLLKIRANYGRVGRSELRYST
ncbi:MAG TPA: SusC/RagA family TonB-linked outer membrane protein, partial [Saprospiraceae bacterium]|nr:SusC/RagA family TonB-linked outer membrane protein [Saprospiraceae bacterium]